jgi:hypothetical protein
MSSRTLIGLGLLVAQIVAGIALLVCSGAPQPAGNSAAESARAALTRPATDQAPPHGGRPGPAQDQ